MEGAASSPKYGCSLSLSTCASGICTTVLQSVHVEGAASSPKYGCSLSLSTCASGIYTVYCSLIDPCNGRSCQLSEVWLLSCSRLTCARGIFATVSYSVRAVEGGASSPKYGCFLHQLVLFTFVDSYCLK